MVSHRVMEQTHDSKLAPKTTAAATAAHSGNNVRAMLVNTDPIIWYCLIEFADRVGTERGKAGWREKVQKHSCGQIISVLSRALAYTEVKRFCLVEDGQSVLFFHYFLFLYRTIEKKNWQRWQIIYSNKKHPWITYLKLPPKKNPKEELKMEEKANCISQRKHKTAMKCSSVTLWILSVKRQTTIRWG